MMGLTHATSGAAVWLAGCAAAPYVAVQPTLRVVVVGAAVCAVGALVPDFDHPRSIASNFLPPATNLVAWLTRILSRAVYRATAGPDDDRGRHCGSHRGLTHTVPWALLIGVAAAVGLTLAGVRWPVLAGWAWLGLPLGVGCLVHTLGDWLTKHGVPLAWPLMVGGRRWRRFGAPLRFRTGGVVESAFGVAVVAVGFGALWLMLPAAVPASAPATRTGVVVTPSPSKIR